MLALSVMPYFAEMIMIGNKTVECRSWRTDYRGDIVICATAVRRPDTEFPIIPGHALCIVELYDIRSFKKSELDAALLLDMPRGECWAWLLRNPRPIIPIPVKGQQRLWHFDREFQYIPMSGAITDISDAEFDMIDAKYWSPISVEPAQR